MALETLKNVKEIGGFSIYRQSDIGISWTGTQHNEYDLSHPILIDHENNTISFNIQSDPIKEVGVNGCQVDTLIHAAKLILEGLNAKFPSEYNEMAINKLDMAIRHLEQRTKDREARNVEGTSAQ